MKIFGRNIYGPFDQRTKDYKKSRKQEGGDGSGPPGGGPPAKSQTTAPRILAGFYLGPKLRKPSGEVANATPPPLPPRPVVVDTRSDIPRTTRRPTAAEIDAALALSKPEFTKQGQVAAQVIGFIDKQLEGADPNKTTVVLIGENHYSQVSTMVELAAMARFRKTPGGPTPRLLMEYDQDELDRVKDHRVTRVKKVVERTDRPVHEAIARIRTLPQSHDAPERDPMLAGITAYSGEVMGFRIQPFDPARAEIESSKREPLMLQAIEENIEAAGPGETVIVKAGSFHVPKLRAGLRGKTNLVCMAWVPSSVLGYGAAGEKRFGALLNKPDILAYKSGGSIESAKFDFTRYLGDLGVEIDVASAKAKSAAVQEWLDGQPQRLMRPGTSPTEVSNVRLDPLSTKDPNVLHWVQSLPDAPAGTLQAMAKARKLPGATQLTGEPSSSITPTPVFVSDPTIEEWLERLAPPKDPAP